MADDDVNPNEDAPAGQKNSLLAKVIAELQGREGLLVNRSGQGCINLPGPRGVIRLESPSALRWLAVEFFRVTQEWPAKSQLTMLVLILQGIAENLPPQTSADQELWDRIDDEPVIQAVIALLEEAKTNLFKGTMTQLREELTKVAKSRQIACGTKWPRTANQLGRRLNNLEPMLRAAGYSLSRDPPTNKKRTVRIKPIHTNNNDDSQLSSPLASPLNSQDMNQIGLGDDGDNAKSLQDTCDAIELIRRAALNDVPVLEPPQESRNVRSI